jgi:hypothetical protein
MPKLPKKGGQLIVCQTAGRGQRATAGHRPARGPRLLVAGCRATSGRQPAVTRRPPTGALNYSLPKFCSFFLPTYFLHMWSTLVGWLEHMPALPRLLQKI